MDYGEWSDRKVYMAIAATIFIAYLLLHLVFGRHDLPAYDVYSYISFAEHYSEHWFTTRAAHVAHGLETVSYPPLVFQVMALLSFLPLVTMVDVSILLLSLGATSLSFAVYILFMALTDIEDDRAPLIILFIAFSPGLLKFVLVHGQLPLTIGLTFGFIATTLFYRILQGKQEGVYLVIALALTAYAHHFSFILMTVMILVIAVLNIRDVVSRIDYLLPVALASAFLAAIGLFPLVQEMLFGVSQGRIFHGSRDPIAALDVFHQFLTTTYGVTALGLILLLRRRLSSLTLNLLTLVFLILGLGFVTPWPEALFGGYAEILTYDRFSLIASLFLAAVVGGSVLLLPRRLRTTDIPVRAMVLVAFILLGIGTVFFANMVHHGVPAGYEGYNETQTRTAVDFLRTNASDDYLYVTRGHLPPADEIRVRTDVPTLDTGYYPGRELGFLESSAKFDRVPNDEFAIVLSHAKNLSLKYVIAFDRRSDPVLEDAGWEPRPLGNDVVVWMNPGPVPVYEPEHGPSRPLFGVMPLVTMLLGVIVLTRSRARETGERLLQRMKQMLRALASTDIGPARWTILLLPLIAAAPAFVTTGAYPAGIDTPAHIFKIEMMQSMLASHGTVFHWTDWWYNGYPFLALYPPLSIYALHGVDLLMGDITLSYNLMRLLALVALAASVYLISARVLEDRRAVLFATTLAVFSYPLYNNLFTVGRLASALALPVYLALVYLLLRDDVFQARVSWTHVLIGISSGVLALLHTLMAYLFVYTGLIFLFVYRDRVRDLGIRPVVVTAAIPLAMAGPYLIRLLRHSSITDPTWYVITGPFDVVNHVTHSFTNTLPHYTGIVPVAFLLLALARFRRIKDRFFLFCLGNVGIFYYLFWFRNYSRLPVIPFFAHFDQARFEILFTVFAIFIAAYGFRYLITEGLPGADRVQITLFVMAVLGVVILDASPMLSQSANWEPVFADELDEIHLDDDYRAMGVGMREWDSYLLPEMGVRNTFGWFNQANPNFLFTRSLQMMGGRWFGGASPPGTIRWDDPRIRETLMRLSNTRYVVAAKGKWVPEGRVNQVKGEEPMPAPADAHVIRVLENSTSFTSVHASEHLAVFRLDQEMSYCRQVDPYWIDDERYRQRAAGLIMSSRPFSAFPVKGSAPGLRSGDVSVSCTRKDPHTISLDVSGEGWVLVKESYYPFWERPDGREIYNGFGFMVTHVTDDTRLTYRPPSLWDIVSGR